MVGVLVLPLALAFVVPPSLVHSRPRLIAAASPLIMEEGTKPEVVTRKQISEKMADSMQYGGQLSVYMLLRPKLEALFEAVAGGKDAVVSSEQLGTRESSTIVLHRWPCGSILLLLHMFRDSRACAADRSDEQRRRQLERGANCRHGASSKKLECAADLLSVSIPCPSTLRPLHAHSPTQLDYCDALRRCAMPAAGRVGA